MAHKSKAHYFFKQVQILYIGRGGISDLHQHHMIQLGITPGYCKQLSYLRLNLCKMITIVWSNWLMMVAHIYERK